MIKEQGIIKARYDQLAIERQPYLERGRSIAALTKPYFLPEDGDDGNTDYPTPWQSTGAIGVTSFASKLGLALFPYQNSWFQYKVTNMVDKDQLEAQQPGAMAEIENQLSIREEGVRDYIETTELRTTGNEWFEHMTISGNVLAKIPLDGSPLRSFGLERYVVKRDNGNDVLEIIIKDSIRPSRLPAGLRSIISLERQARNENIHEDQPLELYTQIKFDERELFWIAKQEVGGFAIPEIGVDGFGRWERYPIDALPYIPLRWRKEDGRDYGRSYIEDFVGDLYSLEVVSQALNEGAQIASRTLIGVPPGSATKAHELSKAKNGAVVIADFFKEVTTLNLNKDRDYNVALRLKEELKTDLRLRFHMKSGVQRQGERVTATEIMELIEDLNQSSGATFALFMKELQVPVISIYERRMENLGLLIPLPEGIVDRSVTTGLEALGRQQDLKKTLELCTILKQVLPPEEAAIIMNNEILVKQIMSSMQIDIPGLIKSPEEIAKIREQIQQQSQLQQMMPLAGPAANLISKSMDQQQGENPNG